MRDLLLKLKMRIITLICLTSPVEFLLASACAMKWKVSCKVDGEDVVSFTIKKG